MRAAVLRELGRPIRVETVPDPAPEPDEVLLRVEACGVCHSDLHLAAGDWPQLNRILKLPLILGHEIVGRVAALGAEVRALSTGDRVGVAWVHWTCGSCEMCAEGRENLCLRQAITGATVDGGYAELVRAKASHVTRVPDALGSMEAAPLFCAGVTVHRALRNAGVAQGQRVAIFGIGGLGHLAVQLARRAGAAVVAVDVDPRKLELARALGAAEAFAAADDLRARFRALGGVHAAVVTSAAAAAYGAALGSLRRGGTLAVVGIPAENLSIPPMALVSGEHRIVASAVGTRSDVREVLDVAAAGGVRCLVEARSLEDVHAVFDELRRGAIRGRAVLQPS